MSRHSKRATSISRASCVAPDMNSWISALKVGARFLFSGIDRRAAQCPQLPAGEGRGAPCHVVPSVKCTCVSHTRARVQVFAPKDSRHTPDSARPRRDLPLRAHGNASGSYLPVAFAARRGLERHREVTLAPSGVSKTHRQVTLEAMEAPETHFHVTSGIGRGAAPSARHRFPTGTGRP